MVDIIKDKFSLILATVDRLAPVREFMEALYAQTYNNYELIVVDQNTNDQIEQICLEYDSKMQIKYVKTDRRGLSLARNIGLKYISGDIIAFPDDDCKYPPDVLLKVKRFFAENPNYSILTGSHIDTATKKRTLSFLAESCRITSHNVFSVAIAFSIFIKKGSNTIRFDEQFGTGCVFGSAEETDYLFRLLRAGTKGFYSTDIEVYHADRDIHNPASARFYNYALGLGAYFKKHMFWGRNWNLIGSCFKLLIIRPIGGMLVSLVKFNLPAFAKYKAIFKGRFKGFISYDRNSYATSKTFDQ